MTELNDWVMKAVRCLSKESAETVRREIQEHYEAAREAALRNGLAAHQAEFLAVQALGDPLMANIQYRKVLLTSSEASLLRQSNLEARMICSKGWLKWALLSAPGVLLLLSAILLAMHNIALARGLLMLGTVMAVLHIGPYLPIYTPTRGRIFRAVKWTSMIGCVVLLFGRSAWSSSWLLASCVFPIFWIEWRRFMIRRKLPIGQWPKQLYL